MDLTDHQINECIAIARAAGLSLKRLGHTPESCFVVASVLIAVVAKPGQVEEAADQLKALALELEPHIKKMARA